MKIDHVWRGFLEQQYADGMALAAQSDLFELLPLESLDGPPDRYIAKFRCRGLVRSQDGSIDDCDFFSLGFWFRADHLRKPDWRVATILAPLNVFHPNVHGHFCCLGHILPGIGLVDLIYQSFELLVYRNWAPHDGLNLDACQWARNHPDRFPTDPRPLKRQVRPIAAPAQHGALHP